MGVYNNLSSSDSKCSSYNSNTGDGCCSTTSNEQKGQESCVNNKKPSATASENSYSENRLQKEFETRLCKYFGLICGKSTDTPALRRLHARLQAYQQEHQPQCQQQQQRKQASHRQKVQKHHHKQLKKHTSHHERNHQGCALHDSDCHSEEVRKPAQRKRYKSMPQCWQPIRKHLKNQNQSHLTLMSSSKLSKNNSKCISEPQSCINNERPHSNSSLASLEARRRADQHNFSNEVFKQRPSSTPPVFIGNICKDVSGQRVSNEASGHLGNEILDANIWNLGCKCSTDFPQKKTKRAEFGRDLKTSVSQKAPKLPKAKQVKSMFGFKTSVRRRGRIRCKPALWNSSSQTDITGDILCCRPGSRAGTSNSSIANGVVCSAYSLSGRNPSANPSLASDQASDIHKSRSFEKQKRSDWYKSSISSLVKNDENIFQTADSLARLNQGYPFDKATKSIDELSYIIGQTVKQEGIPTPVTRAHTHPLLGSQGTDPGTDIPITVQAGSRIATQSNKGNMDCTLSEVSGGRLNSTLCESAMKPTTHETQNPSGKVQSLLENDLQRYNDVINRCQLLLKENGSIANDTGEFFNGKHCQGDAVCMNREEDGGVEDEDTESWPLTPVLNQAHVFSPSVHTNGLSTNTSKECFAHKDLENILSNMHDISQPLSSVKEYPHENDTDDSVCFTVNLSNPVSFKPGDLSSFIETEKTEDTTHTSKQNTWTPGNNGVDMVYFNCASAIMRQMNPSDTHDNPVKKRHQRAKSTELTETGSEERRNKNTLSRTKSASAGGNKSKKMGKEKIKKGEKIFKLHVNKENIKNGSFAVSPMKSYPHNNSQNEEYVKHKKTKISKDSAKIRKGGFAAGLGTPSRSERQDSGSKIKAFSKVITEQKGVSPAWGASPVGEKGARMAAARANYISRERRAINNRELGKHVKNRKTAKKLRKIKHCKAASQEGGADYSALSEQDNKAVSGVAAAKYIHFGSKVTSARVSTRSLSVVPEHQPSSPQSEVSFGSEETIVPRALSVRSVSCSPLRENRTPKKYDAKSIRSRLISPHLSVSGRSDRSSARRHKSNSPRRCQKGNNERQTSPVMLKMHTSSTDNIYRKVRYEDAVIPLRKTSSSGTSPFKTRQQSLAPFKAIQKSRSPSISPVQKSPLKRKSQLSSIQGDDKPKCGPSEACADDQLACVDAKASLASVRGSNNLLDYKRLFFCSEHLTCLEPPADCLKCKQQIQRSSQQLNTKRGHPETTRTCFADRFQADSLPTWMVRKCGPIVMAAIIQYWVHQYSL